MAKDEQLDSESRVRATAVEKDIQEQAEERVEEGENHDQSWCQILRRGSGARVRGSERFLTAQVQRLRPVTPTDEVP